ncbi:hypothetical protein MMG00_12615 [Ignatzschineria rhizosphaerae]|uniref:Fimbrial protein n=1 Tax=Ignatzschineria rhizosphaerae TaxID=2923279 RepID=A0ABY3X2A8_9GAMM|nr:hypothetical protein [Ignatzschineria rhizosphaerae]UNM96025.1 hypothetical protein MMG00_12615 [Ignatzschineria rhizosphaerae]
MMKPFTKSILSIGAGILLFSSASLAYAQCTRVPNSGAASAYDIFSYSLATSQGGGGNAGQAQFNYGVLMDCRAGSQINIVTSSLVTANNGFRRFLNTYNMLEIGGLFTLQC